MLFRSFIQSCMVFTGVKEAAERSNDLLPLLIAIDCWPNTNRTHTSEADIFSTAILWAAPKKKTSHSKKRMRMTNKWLKPIEHCGHCPNCGYPKLSHVLCGNCFKITMKKTAEYRRKLFNNDQEEKNIADVHVH